MEKEKNEFETKKSSGNQQYDREAIDEAVKFMRKKSRNIKMFL